MLGIVRKFRGMIALYIGSGVACAVTASLSIVFLQRLVDGITSNPSLTTLAPALALYGAFTCACLVLSYAEEFPHNRLYHGFYQRLKQSALEKIARVDYTSYQNFGTGRLVQLVENGASAGRDILFRFWLRIAAHLFPEAVLSIVFIGAYNPTIMLAALCGYVLVFVITRLLLKHLYDIKERALISEEWLTKSYVRAFMEMTVFRINRRFQSEICKVEAAGNDIARDHTRIKLVHELFFVSFALIVWAIKLALLAVGIGLIARGEMTVGVLLALLTLVDRVYEPIAIYNVIFVDYKLDRVAWDRLGALLGAPDDPGMTGGEPLAITTGAIRLENVSFSYGAKTILSNLSLDIPSGETTALVGQSGAGKSTIAKLALALIKPDSGRVLVDGTDLASVSLDSYYRHIAYISQDTPVFDGTLRENICFDTSASDTDLLAALNKAGLSAFMATLPHGLDTEVGEHGVKLSGGEKQRLAFARVFFFQPSIIILDEPTSALDGGAERRVVAEMADALSGRTILAIAHRLSTIRNADQIVVLKDGRVDDIGTHAELLARSRAYSELVGEGAEGDRNCQ